MFDQPAIKELNKAQAIAAAAQAEAQKNNWNVSIAIVDAGGHLLHFQIGRAHV